MHKPALCTYMWFLLCDDSPFARAIWFTDTTFHQLPVHMCYCQSIICQIQTWTQLSYNGSLQQIRYFCSYSIKFFRHKARQGIKTPIYLCVYMYISWRHRLHLVHLCLYWLSKFTLSCRYRVWFAFDFQMYASTMTRIILDQLPDY